MDNTAAPLPDAEELSHPRRRGRRSSSRRAPLSVRELHRAYVAGLTPGDLAGADDGVIDQPTAADDAGVCGAYASLHIEYPIPDDLVEIVWEADDTTVPTIDG